MTLRTRSSGRPGGRAVPTLLAAVVAVALLAAPAAGQGPSPEQAARAALKRLVKDTRGLPNGAADARTRSALVKLARRARASKNRPCKAVKLVGKYRRGLRDVDAKRKKSKRPRAAKARGKLQADAFAADAALKQLPKSGRCGGGAAPPPETLEVDTSQSDTQGIELDVALPRARWTGMTGGGRDFTALDMEGADSIGKPGEPGVPAFTRFLAVPLGAEVSVDVTDVESYTLRGVELFPQQEEAVDAPPLRLDPRTFQDPPFEIDKRAFRSRTPIPATRSSAATLGTMRDLTVGAIQLPGAQFFPRQERLKVFTRIDVSVRFGGVNTERWRIQRRRSVFERAFSRLYESTLENYKTVAQDTQDAAATDDEGAANEADETVEACGEDMLVITSAALRPAADTFADARRAAGLVVEVHETGTGEGQIGDENIEIRDFIRAEINDPVCTRPTYVVLFGDASHVPTFSEPCASAEHCPHDSDLSYSLDGIGEDPFADVLLGRIPAPDLAAADTMVQKIVGYETTPPAPPGDDFYNHATVTADFEGLGPRDARTFTIAGETVRAGLRSRGHVVDRLYHAQAAADIQEFNDGTPIPAELRRPDFGWDADRQDVISALNDGRFLFMHRDHGAVTTWANPPLGVNDMGQLTNGTQLPVVFAINCSSGAFQFSTQSVGQRMLADPDGGAAGYFGDTDVSPSSPNTRLAIGFADALFPNTVPAHGAAEPLQTMGEVLNAGKVFMGNGASAASQLTGNAYREHLLWHYLGDPSMRMWSAEPASFDLAQVQTLYRPRNGAFPIDDPAFRVELTMTQPGVDGTIATLRHGGEPIGRAIVQDGQALISPERRTSSHDLTVALERDGFLQAEVPVSAPRPSHTIECPPTFGENTVINRGQVLQGGGPIRDGLVRLRYTTPTRQFERAVLTDDEGRWQNSEPIAAGDEGTWKVEAFFQDKGVKDAVCEFQVS